MEGRLNGELDSDVPDLSHRIEAGGLLSVFKRARIFSRRSLSQYVHSIRFRLVLWFVLILGAVLVAFSAFIYLRQVRDIRSIALAELNYTVERYLGPGHEGENEESRLLQPGQSDLLVRSNLESQQDHVIALQGSDGKILQSTGVMSVDQIQNLNLPLTGWTGVEQVRVPKGLSAQATRYLFINPAIQQDGQAVGYLLVGVPLDPNNQSGRLLLSLVFGNLLTLAIALTGGFWLADQAMRPVHTITQTARQIGETDLSKRLHLAGNDELTELANTFDAMLDRLQAAFERQRQFTADASHELRTPLTIIDLESTRALANRRTVAEYETILQTIKSENQFMVRLVNNLLALARMDAGQMKLNRESVDLGDLALEVVERIRPLADANGVELTIGDAPETIIQGDRATLVQMLTNLVENAIKYSATVPRPQIDVSVGQREEQGAAKAWVRVSDNGIGISADHLQNIFNRFYQVEASRNHSSLANTTADEAGSSGTGLGLAIAQWIAQAHAGEIRVQSVPGKGASFEVLLPADHHQ